MAVDGIPVRRSETFLGGGDIDGDVIAACREGANPLSSIADPLRDVVRVGLDRVPPAGPAVDETDLAVADDLVLSVVFVDGPRRRGR